MHSKNKGKRGELEACAAFREHGFEARRTVQYCGRSADSSDIWVEGLDKFLFEVKRVEKGNPYDWIAQAKRDAAGETDLTSRIPVVLWRRNDHKLLVIQEFDTWIEIVRRSDLVEGTNG